MPQLIGLATFSSARGDLTVFEKMIPGSIKRVSYTYGVNGQSKYGGLYEKAWNTFICLKGSCRIYYCDGENQDYYLLSNPGTCLIVEPGTWHMVDCCTDDAILLVLCNEDDDVLDCVLDCGGKQCPGIKRLPR